MTLNTKKSPELTDPGLEGETSADKDGRLPMSSAKRGDRENGSLGRAARHRWLALGGRGAGPNQPRGTCKPRLAAERTSAAIDTFR